jgi:DNA-binding LacI/PurR family transcriptional regulator
VTAHPARSEKGESGSPAPTTDRGPIGLVVIRPGRLLGLEPFLVELMEGIEEVFSPLGRSLRFITATSPEHEVAIWRRWAELRAVDAIVMLDPFADDDRLDVLAELDLPAVLLGGADGPQPITNVYVDSGAGAADTVDALADLGHRRIAYVGGPHQLLHSQARTAAFLARCSVRQCAGLLAEGDYYEASGRQATLQLLRRPQPPTAIFYDNIVMAVAGLAVIADLGLAVPDDVSVVVWDDTALSRLTQPGLSVVAVDVHRLGVAVAEAVLEALAGAPVTTRTAPRPQVRLRGSTAPPRSGSGGPSGPEDPATDKEDR